MRLPSGRPKCPSDPSTGASRRQASFSFPRDLALQHRAGFCWRRQARPSRRHWWQVREREIKRLPQNSAHSLLRTKSGRQRIFQKLTGDRASISAQIQRYATPAPRLRCAIVMLATCARALRGPVTCARRHAPRRAAAAVAEVQAEANPLSSARDDLKLMKRRITVVVENTVAEPGGACARLRPR